MGLDVIGATGLLLIGDPHLADVPPGQRLAGYFDQIMTKLEACLDHAADKGLAVVLLGDLFHWPRDNSNKMLVDLIGLFGTRKGNSRVWAVIGNHDKYQSRFTEDVSLAVLEAAGVLRLMKEPGPQFILEDGASRTLVCSTPEGSSLPKKFDRREGDPETVVWLTHHNIQFPEFIDRAYTIKELPGIDWLINGHIHRPQPTITKGQTTWANPGNITRLTFTQRTMDREPAVAIWRPGCRDLEKWVVPFERFEDVFPNLEFLPEEEPTNEESNYVKGLERLAWQRTQEGMGLRQFLTDNVTRTTREGQLIWELYEEVTQGE